MSFTVEDYHDLTQLLREHPEWRDELRRLLLSDELLSLPEVVRELAQAQRRTEDRLSALTEAQQRTEERLNALAGIVKELVEAQRRTEERLDALAGTVKELVEAQQRTEERLDALAGTVKGLVEAQQRTEERLNALAGTVKELVEAQQRTEKRLDTLSEGQQRLTEGQQRLTDTVGGMKDRMLEIVYRERAGAYFGRFLRGMKVVEPHTLEKLETALTADEFDDLLLLDLLVMGKVRHAPESSEVWLAVEISSVIDGTDVARAVRRASLMRRAGYPTVPVVAGEEVTTKAEQSARDQNVVLMRNRRVNFWKEALEVQINSGLPTND